MSEFAKNASDPDDVITVFGHGSPGSIRDDRPGKKGNVSIEDICNDIKNHPDFRPCGQNA